MSDELEVALILLVYVLTIPALSLNLLILSKTFGWNNDSTVTLKGAVETKLKGEVTTGAADNYRTELAAGKNAKAAEANLKAQETALKVAEANERTEQLRLDRAKLENPGPR
jgi:hypothetical protein